MRPSKIRMLIRLVEESDIGELEVSSWGRKVCIRKKATSGNGNNPHVSPIPQVPPPAAVENLEVTTKTPQKPVSKTQLTEIKSPIVGTFYKAPAPDAKAYVEVGQQIKPGQVLCIIEAMKLMNEIESEIHGRVVEILVENAKPVQFGQALFLVEPL